MDKYFLCGFDVTMFKNTKSADEIARALRVPVQQASKQEHPCGVQSMELRAEFQVLTDRERSKYNYEKETKKILDRLVSDCDRRIRIATERVEMERAERARVYGMVPVHDKQALAQLADQTQCMQKKIEQLGIIGDVDGAEKAMKELDEIAERRKKLEEVVEKECERRVETMKRLIVCPLSGVFLNTHDNEQRVRDHQMGKQYLGWKRIRELKERLADILRKRAEGKGEENDRVYSKPLGKREDEEEEEEEDRAAAEAETEVKPPSEEKYRKVAVEEKEAPKVKDEEKKTEKKKEALVVVKRRKIEKEDDQKPEAPDEKNILSDVPPPPSSRPFDGAPAAGTTTTTTTTTTNNTTMTHVSEEEKVDDNTIKKKDDYNSHPREHHRRSPRDRDHYRDDRDHRSSRRRSRSRSSEDRRERDSSDRKSSRRRSCLLYTSPSPRDKRQSRMPSSA